MDCPESDDGLPVRTYSLSEVAAMVCGDELEDPERWLRRLVKSGKVSALQISRGHYRFTQRQLDDLLSSLATGSKPTPTPVETAEPERYPAGQTRRSWMYRQRYRIQGNPNLQGPRRPGAAGIEPASQLAPAKTHPVPSYFKMVHAEPKEVIDTMPALTKTQEDLLLRVQQEGMAVVNGRFRKTVEGLARRGLVTYEAAYVLSDSKTMPAYIYRFTVRGNTPRNNGL